MNIESIGTWAGEVYKALENSDTRMLGFKLGWLGREGKITLAMNDEDLVIALV